MRIAIVLPTNGAVSGGAAKHLRKVVPLLLDDHRITSLRVFLPAGAIADLPAEIPVENWMPNERPFAVLKRRLAAYAPDVVFVPTARYVRTSGARTVVMVRNMEPLETPFAGNRVMDKAKNVMRFIAAWHACVKAHRVIAVSDHVKKFLVRRLGINALKIGTVYHGVEDPPVATKPDAILLRSDQTFIFTAGSIRPARGLPDLINALADPRLPGNLHLVIGGASDPGVDVYRRELDRLATVRGVSDRIIWAGHLSASEIAWCFREAAAFVTTSRAEACPNIVLEAMRQGAVSVATQHAPMPEFYRDTALYYRPGDAGDLAHAIDAVLNMKSADRQERRERAHARSLDFEWSITARRTLNELLSPATQRA